MALVGNILALVLGNQNLELGVEYEDGPSVLASEHEGGKEWGPVEYSG